VAHIAISNVDKKSAEGEVPVRLCNYTDVYRNHRINNHLVFMEGTASRDQVGAFTLRRGDVLLTKDSETADDIGIPAFVSQDLPGVVCGYHLARVRPNLSEIDGTYLYWTIESSTAQSQLAASASGVTRFGLRYESIANLAIPMHAMSVQQTIAAFLDRETKSLGVLIAAKGRAIELLKERLRAEAETRTSLGKPIRLKRLIGMITSGGLSQFFGSRGRLLVRLR
jgi:type I restriction enzyme S subunit